jgi:hypothetical protein
MIPTKPGDADRRSCGAEGPLNVAPSSQGLEAATPGKSSLTISPGVPDQSSKASRNTRPELPLIAG